MVAKWLAAQAADEQSADDPSAIVEAFFSQWALGYAELCDAFNNYLTVDCVWEQSGLPTITGPAAAVELISVFRDMTGVDSLPVEIRNIASNGSVVFAERIDHMRRADGSLIVSAPVTGVLQVQGGKICAWREYFDPQLLLGLLPAELLGALKEA